MQRQSCSYCKWWNMYHESSTEPNCPPKETLGDKVANLRHMMDASRSGERKNREIKHCVCWTVQTVCVCSMLPFPRMRLCQHTNILLTVAYYKYVGECVYKHINHDALYITECMGFGILVSFAQGHCHYCNSCVKKIRKDVQ
jgi:hypothetical protein